MPGIQKFLLISVAICGLTPAHAQTDTSQHKLTSDAPTGSMIRQDVAWSAQLPLNRTYAQLTPAEKAEFHRNYESIAPGDEPPFPLDGLKPIVSAISKAQRALLARGELRLIVNVGPDGKAQDVSAYGKVDNPQMAKFAAQVLALTKFKPAVCAGRPCAMQFPFSLKLKVD